MTSALLHRKKRPGAVWLSTAQRSVPHDVTPPGGTARAIPRHRRFRPRVPRHFQKLLRRGFPFLRPLRDATCPAKSVAQEHSSSNPP